MAQKNRSDLTTQANVIKNETVARRNTALRVGTMNVDEIDSFKNFETDKDVNIWYVSTSGNDANVGSEKSRPFKNLMAAHAAASANEVIQILDVGFTSSSALTFTKPLIIIGPANNEHGILGATIGSTLSLSATLTLINVKFTCTVTMSTNRTIIVKNSFFNPTSLSARLVDLEIYDSTHFVKTTSQLRTLTAKGVYFEDTNLLSIGRNFELYNCVSDGSITAGLDSSATVILKNSSITGALTVTGDLDIENTSVKGALTVSGVTDGTNNFDKLDKISTSDQTVASNVDFAKGINVVENVGIGTDSPVGIAGAKILDLFAGSSLTSQFVTEGNDGEGFVSLVSGQSSSNLPAIMFKHALRFATATSKDATGFSEAMRIDGSGNVFIGKTTGSEKLEVNGNVLADKLAANVATILNTGDFGGGVAIGSGFAGISTAPLNGAIIEGNLVVGAASSISRFEVHGAPGSVAHLRTVGGLVNESAGILLQNGRAAFGWDGALGAFRIFTSDSTKDIIFANSLTEGAGEYARFTGDGMLGLSQTNPQAKADINQSDDAAAIPPLKLTQADLSEEMIKFDPTTIGIGNPIEAIGAKSFTQTHFLKINVEGLGVKYMPIGDLA